MCPSTPFDVACSRIIVFDLKTSLGGYVAANTHILYTMTLTYVADMNSQPLFNTCIFMVPTYNVTEHMIIRNIYSL